MKLGLSQHIVEQLSSLRHEVYMIREIVMPKNIWHISPHVSTNGGRNKSGGYTSTYAPQTDCKKHLKDKGEISTGTLNAGQINETTILHLPTEEEWRQAT